jgi:hypothetical protein
MKKPKAFLLFLLALVMVSCDCITGEGDIVTEQRQVSGFDRIRLGINAKVILDQDSSFSLRVDAQPNILDIMETTVEGNVLNINYGVNCVLNSKDITLYLSMPELRGVDVSGSGDVICMKGFRVIDLELGISGSGEIMMELDAENIQSRISGSGEIDIGGKAKSHSIGISGSGTVYAYNLRTNATRARISGSGDARVFALDKLNASISGSGSVLYKGEPVVESHVSGSGSVKRVN